MNNKLSNREKAQKIYDDLAPNREQHLKYYGDQMYGILARSVDEIEAHLDLVDRINTEHGTQLQASKFEIGTSEEIIRQTAITRRHQSNGRKGVSALVNKYGYDSAKRIVKKHTGKTIR